MKGALRSKLRFVISFCAIVFISFSVDAETIEIENPMIDARGFRRDVTRALDLRQGRRITEEMFLEMAKDKNTIILDARSTAKFFELHVEGARNLPFTDFTESSLRRVIPSKETHILIYCNNNVANAEMAFPSKLMESALNLSTFPSLYSYGYRNVYELGPVIDPAISKIRFTGTHKGRN
jgi:phage shock protein E